MNLRDLCRASKWLERNKRSSLKFKKKKKKTIPKDKK